jgi:hypothetical protein
MTDKIATLKWYLATLEVKGTSVNEIKRVKRKIVRLTKEAGAE